MKAYSRKIDSANVNLLDVKHWHITTLSSHTEVLERICFSDVQGIYITCVFSAKAKTINQTKSKEIHTIVIVISRFLEHPQKRSRRNQLIHRRLTKTKSIGTGQDPESQAARRLWWMVPGVDTGREVWGRR